MEIAAERFAALWFVLIGASHLAAGSAWAQLFARWRTLGDEGGLLNGLLHAPVAVLILAFHQSYEWPAVLITLVGWLLLLKSALYLLLPSRLSKAQALADANGAGRYRKAGATLLFIGMLFALVSLRGTN